MGIDRFLAEPVEVKILGETVKIKPLTVKFYPLISKLAYIENKILMANKGLKKGESFDILKVLSSAEIDERLELEKKIAYQTMKDTFGDEVTEESFAELPMRVITEVMKGAMVANGINDEKLDEVKKLLGVSDEK